MNSGVPKNIGVLPAIRSIFADVLGEDDSPMPVLPAGLPDRVRTVAADALHRLIDYQGPGYAHLYLARLRRFLGRRNVDDAVFADIARLMAVRMAYDDVIRMAQLKLAEAGGGPDVPTDDVCKLRLDELISLLPETVADYALWALEYPGWLHLPVTVRFSAASDFGLRRLRLEASLKRWRLSSLRYARERVWVERWLHMIDRSLTKQPAAVAAVVATAEIVQGHGEDYSRSMRHWNLIIDHLVKPTFDGALPCPDLAGAITEARAAVNADPRQESLKRIIAGIRERAGVGFWPGQ
jgi:hypothetical protein